MFKNVLVSSDVISIVKTRIYGECIYNKKDGTYYVGTGSHYFSPDYKPIKICSVRFAIVQNSNAVIGDVNADGVINSVDALDILRYSVGMIKDFS